MIVAVDPDLSGGIAVLSEGGEIASLSRVPSHRIEAGRRTAGVFDAPALDEIVRRGIEERAGGERVRAVVETPNRNIRAARGPLGFAVQHQNYGAALAILALRCDAVREASPREWKAAMKLTSDKALSRALASERFPEHAAVFALAKNDGLAEAALLGLWLADR